MAPSAVELAIETLTNEDVTMDNVLDVVRALLISHRQLQRKVEELEQRPAGKRDALAVVGKEAARTSAGRIGCMWS